MQIMECVLDEATMNKVLRFTQFPAKQRETLISNDDSLAQTLSDAARLYGSIFTFVTKYSLNYADTMFLANLPIVSQGKASVDDESNPLLALVAL
jgi:hypothetical protein